MDPAALREKALDALGAHADPRAGVLLSHATLSIDEAVRRWTSSGGEVRAHRVRCLVDARSLGVVRAAPAVEDALRAAFASVLSEHAGESLAELEIAWDGALAARMESYRGAARIDGRAHIAEALVEYFEGAGDRVARSVANLEGREVSPGAFLFHGAPSVWMASAVRDAIRHLVGPTATVQWRTR
jgi:hypothetical protein